jgi:hypothetical protein
MRECVFIALPTEGERVVGHTFLGCDCLVSKINEVWCM